MRELDDLDGSRLIRNPIIIEIGKYVRDIVIGFGGATAFYLGWQQIASGIFAPQDWVLAQGAVGYVVLFAGFAFVGFVNSILWALRRAAKRISQVEESAITEIDAGSKLPNELTALVEGSFKQKDFVEVVRIGSQLSRPLWLSGSYKERAQIGEWIADSAATLAMPKEQAAALIDDVGWTNAVLNNVEKAEQNIEFGIKIALDNQLYYLAAKGERHLAGICYKYKRDYEVADEHFKAALEHAEKIEGESRRREMIAGIQFGQAEYFISIKDFEKALAPAQNSQKEYQSLKDQDERIVKSYSQLGRIYLGLSNLNEAENSFHAGFGKAAALRRKDEMIINRFGMAQIHFARSEYSNAIEVLDESIEGFHELGMENEEISAKNLKNEAEMMLSKS